MKTITKITAGVLAISVMLICCNSCAGKTTEADFESVMESKYVQLQKKIEGLRKQYSPYMRSLPEPLEMRKKTPLNSRWLSRYEIEKATDLTRPNAPDWYLPDYDDSAWEETMVPEWRYSIGEQVWEWVYTHYSCILWYRTTFNAELPVNGERIFLVFGGVDWEAEVWLNGVRLGSHKAYYESFKFDVTSLLKKENTLAVRVFDGEKFGEPAAFWAPFNVGMTKSKKGVYTRERAKSIVGYIGGDSQIGSGYGIFREVYLETSHKALVDHVFARADLGDQVCNVDVELNSGSAGRYELEVEILPENFTGQSYRATVKVETGKELSQHRVVVNMKDAVKWQPNEPHLYRCRVKLKDAGKTIDAKDVLFGYRSFSVVNQAEGRFGEGTLLLNGNPIYLRGANIQGLNTLWFWSETDKLLDIILMLKVANFNSVRSNQHVQFPEVREYLDRLGIMSQQDNGSSYPNRGKQTWPQLIEVSKVLARECYNNPGVVLISYANETHFDPTLLIKETLKVDPERVIVPICGYTHDGKAEFPPNDKTPYGLSSELCNNVILSIHPFWGWYEWFPYAKEPWRWCQVLPQGRKGSIGEYGAEALDNYSTMRDNYPEDWPVYEKSEDVLFGHVQVKKDDIRQLTGFRGRTPKNLGEYIQASQVYQADICSEVTRSWRLSSGRVTAYFYLHFIDVLPCHWPKALVSHDLRPKKAYYDMMQVNQPVTPLFKLDHTAHNMEIWTANDLGKTFKNCSIRWEIKEGDKLHASGTVKADVPEYTSKLAKTVSITEVPDDVNVVDIVLVLTDADGNELSRYEKDVFIKLWRNQGFVNSNTNTK